MADPIDLSSLARAATGKAPPPPTSTFDSAIAAYKALPIDRKINTHMEDALIALGNFNRVVGDGPSKLDPGSFSMQLGLFATLESAHATMAIAVMLNDIRISLEALSGRNQATKSQQDIADA